MQDKELEGILERLIVRYASTNEIEHSISKDEAKAQLLAWRDRARIEERQFAFKLVNKVRYQEKTLDQARDITNDRLSALQVDQELPPLQRKEGEKHA